MTSDQIVSALLLAARSAVTSALGERAEVVWPMLEGEARAAAEEAASELAAILANEPSRAGSQTTVLVLDASGDVAELPARYELREAADIVTSHDAARGFQRSPSYPAGIQERAYHADKYEQAKVVLNAREFLPSLVVNTNPDAVNGPPILSSDGFALGGNSRAMTMRLLYREMPEKARELRAYLKEHAHEMGLRPSDVDALSEPVLVRVLDLSTKATPRDRLMVLVRQLNESLTQAMDPRTTQVAVARKVGDAALTKLADEIDPKETLNDYLGKRKSKTFIAALTADGVFNRRNANLYYRKNSDALNQDGKKRVADVLVGKLVDDADILRDLRTQTYDGVARAAPYLLSVRKYGEGYDLQDDMKKAVASLNDMENRIEAETFHVSTLDPKMSDAEFERLFAQQSLFGDTASEELTPRAKKMLEVMIRRRGSVQFSDVMRDYLISAKRNQDERASIFGSGDSVEPEKLFDAVAKKKLAEGTET